MMRLYILIFILCLAAGSGIALFREFSPVRFLVSLIIAGFTGSCIIAAIFTATYFFGKEADEDPIPETAHEEVKRISQ